MNAEKSAGKWMFTVDDNEIFEGTLGACLACGEEACGVEPDARRYTCEVCGAREVYGLEELLIMGRVV